METDKPLRLFCSDLDGTLIGEPAAAADFAATWMAMAADAPVLVYSTGRLHDDARQAIHHAGLPQPDFLTTGVGTVIHDMRSGRVLDGFDEILGEAWDLQKIHQIVAPLDGIEPQPPAHQHRWKRSWFWHHRKSAEIEALREALASAGIGAQVVYSSARDLDILPSRANKGNALEWLCGHLGIGLDEVAVAGDTGNDVSMFLVPGVRGIAPENAEPELLAALDGRNFHHAHGACAAGILRGLIHFGAIREITHAAT